MRLIHRIIFTLVLVFAAGLQIRAQTQNSLYFMDGIPQMNRVNPARQPECGFYIGIPGLSPLSTQVFSDPLVYDDVIYPHPDEDSLRSANRGELFTGRAVCPDPSGMEGQVPGPFR